VRTVRPAVPADAPAIARVHVASWRAAYRGIIPQQVLDELDEAEWAARHRAHLQDAAAAQVILVCEQDGAIIAFLTHGPPRDADVPPRSGELHALYADPAVWGTGAGRALTEAALDALRAAGCDEAVVWVLDDNARGRRFYELAGFTLERSGVPLGQWDVSQSRYRKRL
jgi:ribosomal protein S18 acetylase RimI-like enzyme